MADIQAFIANMSKSGGFARPSQYEVKINPPNVFTFVEQVIRDGANIEGQFRVQQEAYAGSFENRKNLSAMSEVSKQLTLQCQTVTMPSHDLQTQNRAYSSEPGREMVQTHGYAGTIDCTFLLSNDLREKHYFELWQSLAVDNYTHKANYYDDYIGSMEIYQLSSKKVREVELTTSTGPVGTGTTSSMTRVGVKSERTYGIKATEVYPKTVGAVSFGASSANEISTLDVRFEFRQWYNIGTDNKFGTADSRLRPF